MTKIQHAPTFRPPERSFSSERSVDARPTWARGVSAVPASPDGAVGPAVANLFSRAAEIPYAVWNAPGRATRAAGNWLYGNLPAVEVAGERLLGAGAVLGLGADVAQVDPRHALIARSFIS